MKRDCRQRPDDMRKATAAGRHLCGQEYEDGIFADLRRTPQVASVSLAPDFDGYLFATTMNSSWNDTLCPLVCPPTALARRRANTTPMSVASLSSC